MAKSQIIAGSRVCTHGGRAVTVASRGLSLSPYYQRVCYRSWRCSAQWSEKGKVAAWLATRLVPLLLYLSILFLFHKMYNLYYLNPSASLYLSDNTNSTRKTHVSVLPTLLQIAFSQTNVCEFWKQKMSYWRPSTVLFWWHFLMTNKDLTSFFIMIWNQRLWNYIYESIIFRFDVVMRRDERLNCGMRLMPI